MRSTMRMAGLSALLLMLSLASGCAGGAGSYPPRADLMGATEAKPVPGNEIATDPVAEARYNASVEAWGDRLRSAGVRLCKFFDATGMRGLDCP